MSAYADTSLLVSLYVLDANSARAAARITSVQRPVLLSSLNEIEITNAFYLRLFRREIDTVKLRLARSLFQEDIENGIFEVRYASLAVFSRALTLSEKHTRKLGTRSLDVLHVASALVFNVDTFLTFDRNQAKMAKAEGLLVP